ncbi:MAG TPA: hypothetical protein VN519_11940 [Bryobacteraceae bacterium]|nr:hypothetical protein [Bryobacteraceae bacterium]
MRRAHWPAVFAAAIFIGWAHSHTDEIPVVLGFVLLLSAILGLAFPSRPWLTGLIVGLPPFLVETLVHFGVIHAPYPASKGIPWAALLGLVPGIGGALFGSAIRHLNRQQNRAS